VTSLVSGKTARVTERLASEIAVTPAAAIPPGAVAAIKRLVVDHVGITYMGAALHGAPLLEFAKDQGGRADAVLLGDGARVPAEIAAGVNGQHCRVTNWEDSGPGRHIGPLTVHTALAMAQRVGASGRDLVAAAVLGYVIGARFQFAQRVENGYPYHRVVAAAIASRLLGHDAATTARAISLAWEMPHRGRATPATHAQMFQRKRISPLGTPGTLATPLFHARAGIQAALMTGFGFEGANNEIDQHAADYDVERLIGGPPPFHYLERMELKPWPCVRPGQCAIQAIVRLQQAHAIDPARVTAIRLRVPSIVTVPHQNEPEPATVLEAVYSLQWAAAMVLERVAPGPQWLTPQRLADRASRRLAAMVELVPDPESSCAYEQIRRADVRGAAEITVSGRTLRAECALPETWGSHSAPMPEDMVSGKFHEATSLSLDRDRSQRLLAALDSLDTLPDLRGLTSLL
jgi:2-methylcitrate dehydratase PrpD